jgi:hypothetical protein
MLSRRSVGAALCAWICAAVVLGSDGQTVAPSLAPSFAPSAQPTTVQPTTVQPTTAQPTTVQPTTVQPTTVQPTSVQPTTLQPTSSNSSSAGGVTAGQLCYLPVSIANYSGDGKTYVKFGQCCEGYGIVPKPLWFYILITLPIEFLLIELDPPDDAEVSYKTPRELVLFGMVTFVSMVLIILRVLLPRQDEPQCSGFWECYQGVVFLFANSTTLFTSLVLWLRLEVKRFYPELLRATEYLVPLSFLFRPYRVVNEAELRSIARSDTRRGIEHWFSGAVVLTAGGLTHGLLGALAYFPAVLLVVNALVVSQSLRLRLNHDRGDYVSDILALFSFPLVLATLSLTVPVFIVRRVLAPLTRVLWRYVIMPLFSLGRREAALAAKELGERAHRNKDSKVSKDSKDSGVLAAVEVEDLFQEPAAPPAVVKKQPSATRKPDQLEDYYGRGYAVGGGHQHRNRGAEPTRMATSPSATPGARGNNNRAERLFKEAASTVVQLSAEAKRLHFNKAGLYITVMRELKKLCFFDAFGNVVLWGSSMILFTFSSAVNYTMLLENGYNYIEVPLIDFNSRDSRRLAECYIYTFTHPNYTTFLGVLEVVVTMTGTVLLGIGLVRAGLKLDHAKRTPAPAPA